MIKSAFPIAAALTLTLGACGAPTSPEHAIEIKDGWARATAPNQKLAAAYLTIANRGDHDVRLMSVSTELAAKSSLHRSMTHDGIATMRPIDDGLAIAPGGEAVFEPGGDHIMLVGLKGPLVAGQSISLTLNFADGHSMPATIAIVAPGER